MVFIDLFSLLPCENMAPFLQLYRLRKSLLTVHCIQNAMQCMYTYSWPYTIVLAASINISIEKGAVASNVNKLDAKKKFEIYFLPFHQIIHIRPLNHCNRMLLNA